MSFIVHGAKIPVSCDSCPLMRWNDYGIDGELQYCNILRAICEHEEGQRDVDCPLVELPPHGRLIDAEEDEDVYAWMHKKGMIYCPKCADGFDSVYKNDFKYCPNCGAKMEG